MEKPTGRHRKPMRGWGQRVRWTCGAILAAVLCSPVRVRTVRVVERPRPAIRAAAHTASRDVRANVLGAVGNELEPGPGPVRVPRPRRPHPSELGWCVDDDGVRGVRPYLFGVPGRTRAGGPQVEAGDEPGEFDDLAGLVRTWLSLAT